MNTEEIHETHEIQTKFILSGSGVHHVIDLGVNVNGKHEFVKVSDVFTLKNYAEFNSKKEALYAKMVHELHQGKSITNFKSSKYYKYYLTRLKSEYPEFII